MVEGEKTGLVQDLNAHCGGKNKVAFMSGRSLCSSQLISKGQIGGTAETLSCISESQSYSPQFIMKNNGTERKKKEEKNGHKQTKS